MTKYAWLDLETTGLDPKNGQVLEVACVITDEFLNTEATFHSLVKPNRDEPMQMDDFVLKMHTSNSLLEDLYGAVSDVGMVDSSFASFLQGKHAKRGDNKSIIMCGNSIASLDIPFMKEHMPLSLASMHYRTMDVTGLRLGLELIMNESFEMKKQSSHRALGDVMACIREFRNVRDYAQGRMA